MPAKHQQGVLVNIWLICDTVRFGTESLLAADSSLVTI